MTEFLIHFEDLKPEAQKRLLQSFGLDTPRQTEWDHHPIALINEINNPELQ